LSISYHNSTCLSSIFSISFHNFLPMEETQVE
jgi:hypothetical protein